MNWYAVFGVLLFQVRVGHTSTTNPISATIQHRLTSLENMVASLQTQSTSREQKYAALISNILTKLSTNTDEIRSLRSINDHLLQAKNATLKILAQTQTQLGTVFKQLADLTLEYDKCSQRSLKLESVLNMTREDVLDVQSNITDVQLQLQLQAVLPSVHGPTPNVSKIAEISSKIENLEISFNQSEAKLNFFLQQINANSQDIASAGANITKLENDVTTFQVTINTKLVDLTKTVHNNTYDAKTALTSARAANRKITNVQHNTIASLSKTLTSESNSHYFKILLQHDMNQQYETALKVNVAPGSVTGSGYNSSTGKFTAPVSGTYVFWADILISGNDLGYISIVKDGIAFAQGQNVRTVAQVVLAVCGVTPLQRGQQIWFMKDDHQRETRFKGNGKSSYGGAMLHSD